MRVHEITCPKCKSSMKSKAGVPVGQSLACPKCKNKFTVEAPEEADIVDETEVIEVIEDFTVEEPAPPKKKGPPPPPAKKPARKPKDDDTLADEDLVAVKPKKKAVRARDEDEDEEKPRKKKKKKKRQFDDDEEPSAYAKLKGNIFVRIITMVVLLGILAVLGYMLYQKKMAEREAALPVPAVFG
jgi:hypothetical protein